MIPFLSIVAELAISGMQMLKARVAFLVSTPWDHDSGLFWYPPVIPSPWSMANVIGKCGRLLLHGRANQSCVNRHGATPLLLAAEAGHREVISTLLQGETPRKREEEGFSIQ